MHKRKFKRKGKENTAAISSQKILHIQITLNYVLEKVRGRVRVTGECITLRQVSSPEQFPAKKFIASPYFNTTRPVFGFCTEKYMITDSLLQE